MTVCLTIEYIWICQGLVGLDENASEINDVVGALTLGMLMPLWPPSAEFFYVCRLVLSQGMHSGTFRLEGWQCAEQGFLIG